MSLTNLLRAGLREARATGKTVARELERGLQVRLSADPDRVLLLRAGAAPGEVEAQVVGQALGWDEPAVSTVPLPGRAPALMVQPADPDDGGVDLDDEEEEAPATSPVSPAPSPVKRLPPSLPARFTPLWQAAAARQVPRGAYLLRSGLVMDLADYVLAWAENHPHDGAHIERRLDEALDVWSAKELA